MIPPFNCI